MQSSELRVTVTRHGVSAGGMKRRMGHALRATTVAVLGLCAAHAHSQVAPAAAPAPVAAAASGPAALPPVPSQRQTVEELLRKDAEAALAAAAAAAAATAAVTSATAGPAAAPPTAGGAQRSGPPPAPPVIVEPPASIVIESIIGMRSSEKDSRMVEATIDGRTTTMRPGDLFASHRLLGIRGLCATFAKETAGKTAAARAARAAAPARSVKAVAKPREICIDDPASGDSDNSIAISSTGRGPMPSPMFRPTLTPGQPMYPAPGTTSTGAPGLNVR